MRACVRACVRVCVYVCMCVCVIDMSCIYYVIFALIYINNLCFAMKIRENISFINIHTLWKYTQRVVLYLIILISNLKLFIASNDSFFSSENCKPQTDVIWKWMQIVKRISVRSQYTLSVK